MTIKNSVISRILTSLNNSIFQIKDNALYQTVKTLINIAKSLNDEIISLGLTVTNITNTIVPSDTVEDLDGTSDAGSELSYSRGDHKHDYGLNSIDYDRIQEISAASRLLGRGTAGGNNVREITLGSNLTMTDNELNSVDSVSADFVVLSDGVVASPTPINDGAGNFIYVGYSAGI
jgi:hypothetical protein